MSKQHVVVLVGVLAAIVTLAACGGGSSSAAAKSPTPSTAAAGNGIGRLSAFRTCMAGQGITLSQRGNGSNRGAASTTPGTARPAGGFGARFNTPPPGVDATKYEAALNACRSQLPTGGGNFANSTAFQAYRSCLSDHNVKMPASAGFASINRNDPTVKAAMTACRALLPTRGPNGSSSTVTTPGS